MVDLAVEESVLSYLRILERLLLLPQSGCTELYLAEDAFYSPFTELFSRCLLDQAEQIFDIELRRIITRFLVIEGTEIGEVEAAVVSVENQGCLLALNHQINIQSIDGRQCLYLISQSNFLENSTQIHHSRLELHILLSHFPTGLAKLNIFDLLPTFHILLALPFHPPLAAHAFLGHKLVLLALRDEPLIELQILRTPLLQSLHLLHLLPQVASKDVLHQQRIFLKLQIKWPWLEHKIEGGWIEGQQWVEVMEDSSDQFLVMVIPSYTFYLIFMLSFSSYLLREHCCRSISFRMVISSSLWSWSVFTPTLTTLALFAFLDLSSYSSLLRRTISC